MNKYQTDLSYKLAVDYWLENRWAERKHDFSWFIDKFMPMLTWPADWKKLYAKWKRERK